MCALPLPENGIYADGGLIEDQERRLVDERRGQRHPTTLASAQVANQPVRVGKIEKVDEEGGSLLEGRTGHAVEGAKVAERLCGGQLLVEGDVLGHVADAGARHGGGRRTGPLAEDGDLAGVELECAEDAADEGGLAAATRPQQAVDGAARDGHWEALQHRHRLQLRAVGQVEVAHFDGRSRWGGGHRALEVVAGGHDWRWQERGEEECWGEVRSVEVRRRVCWSLGESWSVYKQDDDQSGGGEGWPVMTVLISDGGQCRRRWPVVGGGWHWVKIVVEGESERRKIFKVRRQGKIGRAFGSEAARRMTAVC